MNIIQNVADNAGLLLEAAQSAHLGLLIYFNEISKGRQEAYHHNREKAWC